MLAALIIVFREVFEAGLIVGIVMAVFWHKADIPSCTAHVRFRGVERTCPFAPHMSAFDPKRTFRKQPGHNHDRAIRSTCKAGNRGCRPAAP